jgi:thiamine pyrophosphate-dependent acetolactate synthase large subunit-like protein
VSVVRVDDAIAGCVMAAVAGDVTRSPGAVVVDDAAAIVQALAAARAEQSPLICLGDRAPAGDAVKAVLDASSSSAAHWIAHGLRLAMASPRGPVYLGASDGWTAPALPIATNVRPTAALSPEASALDRAASVIRRATRPVVVVGADARDDAAAAWLRAFAEALPAPVLATWKAKGALADPHPLAFGVVGSTEPARAVMQRADLVVTLGLEGAEWNDVPPHATVVDAGPGAGGDGARAATTAVAGDVSAILADLGSRLAGAHADWDVAELDRWKRRLDVRASGPGLLRTVALAREAMPAGTVATFEQRLRPGAVAWDCVAPVDLHVPARASVEGFAVPAALAAALVRPSIVTLAFTDAAGLAAARATLAAAERHEAALGVIVTDSAMTDALLARSLTRLLTERRPMVVGS